MVIFSQSIIETLWSINAFVSQLVNHLFCQCFHIQYWTKILIWGRGAEYAEFQRHKLALETWNFPLLVGKAWAGVRGEAVTTRSSHLCTERQLWNQAPGDGLGLFEWEDRLTAAASQRGKVLTVVSGYAPNFSEWLPGRGGTWGFHCSSGELQCHVGNDRVTWRGVIGRSDLYDLTPHGVFFGLLC